MSTSIQPTASAAATGIQTAAPTSPAPSPTPARRPKSLPWHCLEALASLKLTVVLFALAMVLVFCGTWAQRFNGINYVVDHYFRTWHVIIWVPFKIFLPMDWAKSLGESGVPFIGGGTLGLALMVNLLAAHAVRFRLTWKRSGILVLHAGLLVLMLGELITSFCQVESQMAIFTGESSNFVQSGLHSELAVVLPSDNKSTDDVVVVPDWLLRKGGTISDDRLPFDIKVEQFMVNSDLARSRSVFLKRIPSAGENKATAGRGVKQIAVEKREGSGVDVNQKYDSPSTYVTFVDKATSKALGTYLMSVHVTSAQKIEADGKDYEVSLRPMRTYKPYTIALKAFSQEFYQGTDVPKDFRSTIHLSDPSSGVERDLIIYMNSPLRYAGEAFFQSGVLGRGSGTILQVVQNPGWLLPYVSCVLVGVGMAVHFMIMLVGFLQKRNRLAAAANPTARQTESFRELAAYLPLGVGCIAAFFVLWAMMPPTDPEGSMPLYELGKIPVVDGGRTKPLDTYARIALMQINNGYQTYRDENGVSHSAIQWLLDVMSNRPEVDNEKMFRVDSEPLLLAVGVKPRPGLRYSFKELMEHREQIEKQAKAAKARDEAQRDLTDQKLIELYNKLGTYNGIRGGGLPLSVPPLTGGKEWTSLVDAQMVKDRSAGPMVLILEAYAAGDVATVRDYVGQYEKLLNDRLPDSLRGTGLETFFNHFAPFYVCMFLCVIVFLLACSNWLVWPMAMRRSAYWLAILTLAIHTWALFTRMYLMDRPFVFVTNLYSSAIFIGWIALIICVILETIYRNGIALAAGGIVGFATLFIAYQLSLGGDTLEMMRAVLDTNFWLATHVTSITIGYAATFVPAVIAWYYLALSWFLPPTPSTRDRILKPLAQKIYGTLCFATLFSFVGTVLGGIWADQSWGRFWGWDPKENGALLIVIWNALILHARWGGMVKDYGVAVLAVFGNIVTSWSYFGTNMLGVGLHAYASASGAYYLVGWMGFNLAIIIAAVAIRFARGATPNAA
jgi:ABC-type transport system involved in cytochrome c biogenesis permease subunit